MKTPLSFNYYTGIGSRRSPPKYIEQMQQLAVLAANANLILRSGAALGADAAFEKGCDSVRGSKEIFLPWAKMNGHLSTFVGAPPEAFEIAETLHPKWLSLSRGARSMHARNVQQILGPQLLSPTKFVLCYTPDGAETIAQCTKDTGGTATAIKLACNLNIHVVNIQRPLGFDFAVELISLFSQVPSDDS